MKTHKEFITKLCAYYKEPLRDGDIPNMRVEENLKWIRQHVSVENLADLFAEIILKFKQTSTVPFPLPPDLHDIYFDMNISSSIPRHEQEALDIGREMTPKDIYTRIWSIRDKESPSNAEIDFIHTWDMLGYHYGRMKDLNRSEHAINEYCEKVKQTILRGDKPPMGDPMTAGELVSAGRNA